MEKKELALKTIRHQAALEKMLELLQDRLPDSLEEFTNAVHAANTAWDLAKSASTSEEQRTLSQAEGRKIAQDIVNDSANQGKSLAEFKRLLLQSLTSIKRG